MKPRLIKQSGLWYCRSLNMITGIGYTPKGAYNDWCLGRDWVFAV